MQGGRAVAEGDRVTGLDRGGERLLELLDVRSLGQPVTFEHVDDGGDVVVVDGLVAVRDHSTSVASSSTVNQRSLRSLEYTKPSSRGLPSIQRGLASHQGCSGRTT